MPSLVKDTGLASLLRLLSLLRLPYKQWPPETLWILRLTPFKSVGFNINVNSRPIKLQSALYRLQAKLLSVTPQLIHAGDSLLDMEAAWFMGYAAWCIWVCISPSQGSVQPG